MKATVEMKDMLKAENTKLKNHIEMQDLTIQKLYAQLNKPPTTFTISSSCPNVTSIKYNVGSETQTDLQTENTKLKQDKENLTTIVANKIIEDFDIETPLKDELNNARLEIISLEEALRLERQEKQELIEFLKKQIETKKQHNAFNKYFYEIKEIEAFLEKLGE